MKAGIISFLSGYVKIELESVNPEGILNDFMQRGISLKYVEKINFSRISAYVTLREFNKIEKLTLNLSFEIKSAEKHGLPVFLMRFKKRYALFGGLGFFALFLWFMGQFIWEFEVVGNSRIPSSEILQKLSALGVYEGVFAAKINEAEIKNAMLLADDDLLWFAININGGHATIVVREREIATPVIPYSIPCNIVAAEDAVILRLDTLKGSAQVQNGYTVKKGDLLISGIVDTKNIGVRFIHAMGYAKARVWRDITAVTPSSKTVKHYTGNIKTRNAIVILGKRINLYNDAAISFENYDKNITQTTLSVPLGVHFPFTFITETYREYTCESVMLDANETYERLSSALLSYASSNDGDQFTDLHFAPEEREGLLGMRLTAECIMDIAQSIEILITSD